MQKHSQKKLTFEFPAEEYIHLKIACAKQGVTMKDFVTQAVIKRINEYEAHLDNLALNDVTQEERENAQSWEDVQKELGWDLRSAIYKKNHAKNRHT